MAQNLSYDELCSMRVFAFLLYRMGRHTEAEKIYRTLLTLSPVDNPDTNALKGLAAIAIEREDGIQALEYLNRLISGQVLSSRDTGLYLMRAQALWLQGRRSEARAALDLYLAARGTGMSS